MYVLDYPIGGPLDAGTWWIADYAIIIFAMCIGLFGYYCKCFPTTRRGGWGPDRWPECSGCFGACA